MRVVFWCSLGFVLYVYAGYPLLLRLWALAARRRRTRAGLRGDGTAAPQELPGVTVVIAARNERHQLPARIENLLASDYPPDRLQIVVASDGSTDGTVDALAPYVDRIEVLTLAAAGKASALNAAVAHARHPILVFADARQRFASDAIRRLVSHFTDARIGAVSGELMIDPGSSTIGEGLGTYWRYEKWLRRHEALVGSTIGVTGAIYAMRRALWQPLPPDTILDDVLGPIRVVLGGHLVTFDSSARAYDAAPPDAAQELRRKMRTLAGNFQLLAQEPRLLVPFVNPIWIQFMSHKLGRLFVPYALIAILVTSVVLASDGWIYGLALVGQLAFYGLAVYGAALDRRGRRTAGVTAEVNREAA
jgi:cellulose synthase/poly-beta-1,6-N-acetylglucosamine synthase-like glycosyltransferase